MSNSKPEYYLFLDTSAPEATVMLCELNSGKLDFKDRVNWFAGRYLSKTLSHQVTYLIRNNKLLFKDLSGVSVFPGPGSFTGLRIGVSFANALAFGLKIPTYEATQNGQIDLLSPLEIVVPNYGAEPKITTPKLK